MKILLISNLNPHFENTNTFRLKALREMGHEPFFFEDRNFLLPGRIRQRFDFLQYWDLYRLNRRMVAFAAKMKPDLCLAVGGYRILPKTLIALKGMGIPTVLWTTDVPRPEFRHVVETAPLYDHIFCAGTEAQERLSEAGRGDTVWLPFGCDKELHQPWELTNAKKQQFGKDMVFVGAYYPNRWEVLKELVGAYDIGIWGPGWRAVIDGQNRDQIRAGYVQHADWVRIYNTAKIILIIHYQDGTTPCFQASPKVFEALACGSFVMADRQKDLMSLFATGKHLVTFADSADLKEKIMYYLDHDDERRSIAAEGHAEVLRRHTYRHRFETMLAHVRRAV